MSKNPRYTKQVYVMVARELAQAFADGEDNLRVRDVVTNTAARFADVFEQDNPRFDRRHFMAVVRGERDANSRPVREEYFREEY